MPVLPEFMPEGTPGEAANVLAQGRTEGESWMSMEQNRRIQAQQAQQQHDEFVAHLPVIHAQAQAQVAQANASIALSTQQQQLMAKSGIVAPDAQNELLNNLQYSDPQTQFDELGKWQAKYAWLKLNPQYAPMLDAADKARGDAFHMATANNLAEATLQRTEALVQGRTDVEAQRAQAVQQRSEDSKQARIVAAQILAGSREHVAETQTTGKLEVANIQTSARANRLSSDLRALQAGADAENQAAQEAIDAGDPEVAQIHLQRAAQYKDAATKASTYAGNSPSEPAKTPDRVPKPKTKAVDNSPPAEVHFTPPDGLVPTPSSESTPKLYTPPTQPGQTPTFTPAVKTAPDVIKAMQQMVDDGVISPDQARETLKKLGFKPKQ